MFDKLIRKRDPKFRTSEYDGSSLIYEYCPNCNADLRKQKGYRPSLNYWTCLSCNTLLTNPSSNTFDGSGIVWLCDGCEACLNEQEGFSEDCHEWKCEKCGYVNAIIPEEVYETNDEYLKNKENPTAGMSMEDVARWADYSVLRKLEGSENIALVRNVADGHIYIRKVLETYDIDVFRKLMENPVEGMPRIIDLFEGRRYLTVVEENIEGQTLETLLNKGIGFDEETAVDIIARLCDIVTRLHSFDPPIIHRDIKPANIMVTRGTGLFLLDINAAKQYDAEEKEDTVLIGTKEYAAPEQYGFGASSTRTDIYAMGVLLNVLVTGSYPKEKTAKGWLGQVINKCIRMDPSERFASVEDMKKALDNKGVR